MSKVEPFFYDEDGHLVINASSNEADDDWLRALRLQEKAAKGDKEAAKELAIMEATPMYSVPVEPGQVSNNDPLWDDVDPKWQEEMKKEMEAPAKRRYWFSIHNLRNEDTLKRNFNGLPIGVWVLDKTRIDVFYVKGFEEEKRAARRQIDNSPLPASLMIRDHFDNPSMYGDWYSIGQTKKEFKTTKEAAEHYLGVFENSWT